MVKGEMKEEEEEKGAERLFELHLIKNMNL